MTNPGSMLQDSITRLRDAISATKAVSDEVKGRVAAQQVSPVTIGEETTGERGGTEQG